MVDYLIPTGTVPESEQQQTATYANTFSTASATTAVTELGYYQKTLGHGKPTALELWDVSTSTRLQRVSCSGEGDVVGWHDLAITPFPLLPYHAYAVLAQLSSPAYLTYFTSTPTPEGNLVLQEHWIATAVTTPSQFPNARSSGWEGLRCTLDASTNTPPTRSTISADLVSWLSDDANDYPTRSTPYETWQIVQSIETKVDALATQLGDFGASDAATEVGTIKTNLASVASDVSSIVTSVGADLVGAVTAGFQGTAQLAADFATWAGNFTLGWTDWLAATSKTWADLWTRLLTGGGALPPVSPVPATGWSLVATTAFDTNLAWSQTADLYVVTFSEVGSNDTTTLVGGIDVVYRLAWWTTLNNSEVRSQRRFLDFWTNECSDGGRRMPGILLHCPRGGSGTVDAWQYTP